MKRNNHKPSQDPLGWETGENDGKYLCFPGLVLISQSVNFKLGGSEEFHLSELYWSNERWVIPALYSNSEDDGR